MNKILLVIQREYLVRVRNKTFILSTILTPLFLVGLITAVTVISIKNVDREKIAVIDNTGELEGNLENTKALSFEFPKGVDSTNYIAKGYTGLLYTPGANNTGYKLISKKQFGLVAQGQLEDKINETLENQLLKSKYNVDVKELEAERKKAGSVTIDQTYQEGSEVKKVTASLPME